MAIAFWTLLSIWTASILPMQMCPISTHRIRFLVVDMKLPFVLGMEQLYQAVAQLDLQVGTLILKGNYGYPIIIKDSLQPREVLSVEMLECICKI